MSTNQPSATADINTFEDAASKAREPTEALAALIAAVKKLQAQIDDLQAQVGP